MIFRFYLFLAFCITALVAADSKKIEIKRSALEASSEVQQKMQSELQKINNQMKQFDAAIHNEYYKRFLSAGLTVRKGPMRIYGCALDRTGKLIERPLSQKDLVQALARSLEMVAYKLAHLMLLSKETVKAAPIWPILRNFETYTTTLRYVHTTVAKFNLRQTGQFRQPEQTPCIVPFGIAGIKKEDLTYDRIAEEAVKYNRTNDEKKIAAIRNAAKKLEARELLVHYAALPQNFFTKEDQLLLYPALYITPEPSCIETELQMDFAAIIKEQDPVRQAAMLYLSVIRIHPFPDGNGRLARLFMNAMLSYYNLNPVHFLAVDVYVAAVKEDIRRILADEEIHTNAHPSNLELLIRQQQTNQK